MENSYKQVMADRWDIIMQDGPMDATSETPTGTPSGGGAAPKAAPKAAGAAKAKPGSAPKPAGAPAAVKKDQRKQVEAWVKELESLRQRMDSASSSSADILAWASSEKSWACSARP